MREKHFKNDYVEFWIENDILFAIYSNKQLTLEAAIEVVKLRYKIVNGKSYPILADYTAGISATKEARDYLAGEEATRYVSAGALVIKNQIQKLLGNAFLTISRPKIPARIFTNREDALKWLDYYKNLN